MHIKGWFVIINLLFIEAKQLQRSRFLSDNDFKNAEHLSNEQIDRGIGSISEKAEFNPKFFGGDIMHKPSKKRIDMHRYITKSSRRHWPNGRVPYEFFDRFSSEEKAHIAKAFSYFHDKTCIRFVNREPEDKSYVEFVKDDGCASEYLGRQRKKPQELSLTAECMRVDIIVHELMHVLGFMHEFSRPDRDQYIEINYDNMQDNPDIKSQFAKQSGELFGDWNLTFDVKSAMFYEGDIAAKKPNLQVLKARNGEELRCKPHNCPTQLDIFKINTLYNCHNYTKGAQHLTYKNVSNITPINSCSSLQWKARKHFAESDNPVISRKSKGGNHLTCRAVIFNGQFRSGETDAINSECIITSIGYSFSWAFTDYDILINPKNIAIQWQTFDRKTNNWRALSSKTGHQFYVTKCSKTKRLLKHLKICLINQYLKC